MQRWIRWVPAIALVASLLFTVSCSRPALWVTTEDSEGRHIQILLEDDSIETLSREALPTQIPAVPVREKLRPCCAFGRDLKVRLGAVPIPGFKIGNIMSLGELGPHLYDSGVFTVSNPQVNRRIPRTREINGLIYTCRGGFIDTAHVRDYADWTLFLAAEIVRLVKTGGVIDLPDEGGRRRIILEPIDSELLDKYGRARVGIRLAEYIGFEMSVWHEIATWFGWSWVSTFPETASAFSPEDLYSNILGTKIAMVIAHRRLTDTEYVANLLAF